MADTPERRNTARGAWTPEDEAEHPEAWQGHGEVVSPPEEAEKASEQLDAQRAGSPQGGEAGGEGPTTATGETLPEGTPSGQQ